MPSKFISRDDVFNKEIIVSTHDAAVVCNLREKYRKIHSHTGSRYATSKLCHQAKF